MLKQPTRIFQITGKQVLNDKVIRFFLHDDLNYTNGGFNLIHCANIYPYHNYQVDDHLGICVGYIEQGGITAPPSQNVFSDRSLVTKVVKAPAGYNGFTIDDLCFKRGWMEEE
ncbi:MAG: hypothetical protein I3273_02825 [Candidatus Moeniiplasma glomeromycotorum]|nr:hypothetical protein [Candidatus Moeniiplasma glomeromycotorum]MCE8167611.1 hypothetical protein [Candidatus Moeniiplasma glomeromycotorum]MCE8169039.1 hypothetical protein [Candidatus Moeniiplasma glomeromycotorum]